MIGRERPVHPVEVRPEPVALHCFCCGTSYRRGSFTCCKRPNGMRADKWGSLWCPPVKEGGCGKCPRHCDCPSKAERLGQGPLVPLLVDFMNAIDPPATPAFAALRLLPKDWKQIQSGEDR